MNPAARFRHSVLSLLLSIATAVAASSAQAAEISLDKIDPIPKSPFSVKPAKILGREKLINYGIVFATQWAVYIADQGETIQDHGSLENWWKHQTSPHFDKDSFDYNLFKHSFVGHYYYLFYRSRGYQERQAFYWAAISSLTFEFGIEALTEKPSFQDIYQTPVFGTIVGMGAERLSDYLHSIGTIPTTVLAYIFNPFTLLPGSKCDCGVMPTVGLKGEAGVIATLNF